MVPDASEFESVRGFGTRAHVAGRVVAVGNERFVANHRGFPSVKTVIDEMAGRGGSIVAVTSGDEMVGVIGVMNRIREEAKDAVADLRKLGIEHMILLTGDHAAAARAIADQAGVRDLKSDLLPTDKVNDSPALARSALGIAMGGAGSPAAIETADVVLMGDDLSKVAGFISVARASLNVVRQNIGFSLVTKAVAAGFALAGYLPLWMAVPTSAQPRWLTG